MIPLDKKTTDLFFVFVVKQEDKEMYNELGYDNVRTFKDAIGKCRDKDSIRTLKRVSLSCTHCKIPMYEKRTWKGAIKKLNDMVLHDAN